MLGNHRLGLVDFGVRKLWRHPVATMSPLFT
jgi:hypothetical protein